MRLTILFDHPYWIGLLEDEHDGLLYAARYIFGAEPSDQTVYEFVLHEAAALLAGMTVGVPIESHAVRPVGYKRMMREAHRATQERGISTQAQIAIKQQIEQNKRERRHEAHEAREAARERKRMIKQKKRR